VIIYLQKLYCKTFLEVILNHFQSDLSIILDLARVLKYPKEIDENISSLLLAK